MLLYNATVDIFPPQLRLPACPVLLSIAVWILDPTGSGIHGKMSQNGSFSHAPRPWRCRGRPVLADFACVWSQGYCPVFFSFSRTKEGPDPKSGFLKQQIFKDAWNLNLGFAPNHASSVRSYDKSDLHCTIRNHPITFGCPVQASSLCRIQPPWVWCFSGRAEL